MKPADLLAIDGVFLAVKCATCGAVYDARSHDFIAFHGAATLGLDQPVLPWSKPAAGKRGSVSVVCRTPECLQGLVRTLLGCGAGQAPDPDALWSQALAIWAGDLALDLRPRIEDPGASTAGASRRK